MSRLTLPEWAQNMKAIFQAGTISQFVLTGNIHDFVLFPDSDRIRFYSLKAYLREVLFAPFQVVLSYDRGYGLQLSKGSEFFFHYLQLLDKFHGTRFASEAGVQKDPARLLQSPGLLPKSPEPALELIDRFLRNTATAQPSPKANVPRSVAVIIDYAHFIVPRGESLYLISETGANLIKILNWSRDPLITGANVITVLLAENLTDLHESIMNNPFSTKIQIRLPVQTEIETFLKALLQEEPDLLKECEVELTALTSKLVGLSRVNIKNLVFYTFHNREPITLKYVSQVKKEIIEKEAFGRLEFIESKRNLDDVAGHEAAKQWFREDARLIKKGATAALPMGYLITGRIGTGKTYLVECFAGECGIPFVVMRNFREKWVGVTEGNLEKIFQILHALGQVVVFVDEADQLTGRRSGGEGDAGLSGRIYGMLAKEMANTENRGKIIWIFATSRPDLLEVDLKRQGRLDVHIPLFPPETPEEVKALLLAMAKKAGLPLKAEELPELPFHEPVSGNELEGLLIRALREYKLHEEQAGVDLGTVLRKAIHEFRPSAHQMQLEYMDLLAVKECTDQRFLPKRFLEMDPAQIDSRLEELKDRLR